MVYGLGEVSFRYADVFDGFTRWVIRDGYYGCWLRRAGVSGM